MNKGENLTFDPIAVLRALGHEVTISGPQPVSGRGARSRRKGYVAVRAEATPPIKETMRHFYFEDFDGSSEEEARASATNHLRCIVNEIRNDRVRSVLEMEKLLERSRARAGEVLGAIASAQIDAAPESQAKTSNPQNATDAEVSCPGECGASVPPGRPCPACSTRFHATNSHPINHDCAECQWSMKLVSNLCILR